MDEIIPANNKRFHKVGFIDGFGCRKGCILQRKSGCRKTSRVLGRTCEMCKLSKADRRSHVAIVVAAPLCWSVLLSPEHGSRVPWLQPAIFEDAPRVLTANEKRFKLVPSVSIIVNPSSPVLYESHMHTPLCKHASGLPGEYAAVAEQRGLKGIIVTCHCPMPDGYSSHVRMDGEQFEEYLDLIAEAARIWAGRQEVLVGLESDFVPGMEDWVRRLHERTEFHHILGSVHPQIGEYRRRFYHGDALEYQKLYFHHLADAAETGLFDTLSHPDLIKNEFADTWELERILPKIRESLDRIAASGCAMELNTSGLLKRISEMNPGPQILVEMCERQIPVVIGADAHIPDRAGDHFVEALALLQTAGYSHVSGFRERKRFEVRIEAAVASLANPKCLEHKPL